MKNFGTTKIRLKPSNPDKLWFDDKPFGKAVYFHHDFGNYSLEARITYNRNDDQPRVISLHGARADYTKANAVTLGLQRKGVSVLAPNLSGHNKVSPIPPSASSLNSNIKEAEAFYEYLDTSKPVVLIGYSLGGTVALEILKKHVADVEKLILFYPAVYAKEAYDKPFSEQFSKVIRKPFSYRKNDILETFSGYSGKLWVIKGEYDGLEAKTPGISAGKVKVQGKIYNSPIPKEVFDMIMAVDMPAENKKLIEVPACGHSVITWMRKHPKQADELVRALARFIQQ